jgi:DNA-binding transcriptional ArsR family regulator
MATATMTSAEKSIERMAKANTHPTRRRILDALAGEEPMSPNGLSQQLDEPLGNVSYHVKTLVEDAQLLELVDTKQRRGALEHYYRRIPALRNRKISDEDALGAIAAALGGLVDMAGCSRSAEQRIKGIVELVEGTGRKVG